MPSHEPSTSREAVRVGLLDDHEVLLDSMASWMRSHASDFDLVLTAHRWVDFVRSEAFPVDLVLMDYQLVEPVSIEARIRTCRAAGAKVVVISAIDDSDSRRRAASAGAIAFLAKTLPMREVIAAVRTAMNMPVPEAGPNDGGVSRPEPPNRPHLSNGEAQALQLYVSGRSTAQVADAMNVKYETAKTYLRRVREKYQRSGRPASRKAELIRRAAEDGYLE